MSIADQAAQRLLDHDGVDHADERERAVASEGLAFGMQLSVLVCWLGALLLAVLGQVAAPVVLILAPLLPALGAHWYAARRGADMYTLMARAPMARTLGWALCYGVVLVLTIAALTYRIYSGQALLPLEIRIEIIGQGLQQAMAVGALIGAGLGLLAGLAITAWIIHRRRIHRHTAADSDDVD